MKKRLRYALSLFALFSLPFCKSGSKITDAPRPPETYLPQADLAAPGTISIPINISMDELQRALNATLSSKALYEDFSYDDAGGDGLMMSAWLSQGITLFASGNTLKYRIPMQLWMKKRLLVGEAEATGELALAFKTTYTINPDWSLSTQTVVEYHDWPTPPVLKTRIGNLSVESVSNLALNRSKTTIAQTIDRIVSQQLSLRPYVQTTWEALQVPTLLSEEYKMWVKTTPTSIGMTPLRTYNNSIIATVAVECLNDVSFGDQPAFRANTTLPPFVALTEASDDFQLRFVTDVPFAEAERMAKSMMVGQIIESGGKRITIQDLQIWGNEDKIVVNSRLAGSFNGNIYFIGRPRFNAANNQIEIADLDFHVDTRNLLHRSAAWMFQGPIKRQMAAAMAFPLDENLTELKKSVQETLQSFEIQPGIILSGTLDSIAVQDTRVTPEGLRVNLFSKGKVSVDVRGL
jgi:hypothetical protein